MTPAAIVHPSEVSPAEEPALMQAVAKGSCSAFQVIIDRFQQPVSRLAQRLLGTEAEDVTQDVFVIVLEQAGRFRGECSLWTWLTRITLNQCRNRIRRQQVRRRFERWFRRSPAHSPPADASTSDSDDASAVRKAVDALPPRDREVIVLAYLEEREPGEIAAVLGRSLNSVEVRLHRARGRLRVVLENRDLRL